MRSITTHAGVATSRTMSSRRLPSACTITCIRALPLLSTSSSPADSMIEGAESSYFGSLPRW